jgi:hypothetical protein
MTKIPYNLFNYGYLSAIDDTLEKSDQYHERRIRREYSTTFHTPLHEVYKLSLSFVLQNYYEHLLQTKKPHELKEIIAEVIPELNKKIEDENQDFAESLVELQKQSIQKKSKPTPKLGQDPDKEQSLVVEPKQPDMNLQFSDENPDD